MDKIKELEEQRNVSACVQLLAGLKFDNALIHRFFREEVMQESVVYQEIIKRGVEQGLQQGLEQGLEQGKAAELALIVRQLSRRIGLVKADLQTQLQALSFSQLEDLGEALLDFSNEVDLVNWLNRQSS